MKHLLKVIETYRVDTEDEALAMRDEASDSLEYDLNTFQYVAKYDKKADQDYFVVKMTKIVNAEKDPTRGVSLQYVH